MDTEKYGKYIIREPRSQRFSSEHPEPSISLRGNEQWKGLGVALEITLIPVSRPRLMEKTPMKHDFDQILCFIGGNPMDLFDFNAEVELHLGEEKEKHIINSTSIVFIPKGLSHGPLNFKRIDKPILFMDIPLTLEYSKQIKEGNHWSEILKS